MRNLTRIIPSGAGPRGGPAPSVLLGTIAGALVVLQAWLLASAIATGFLGGGGVTAVAPQLMGLAAAAVLRAAAVWGQEVLAQRASASVRLGVRDRLLRKLLALGPRFASGERTGELANTLVGGVDALDPYLSQYRPQALLAVVVPLVVLAAVLRADPLSALVLLLTYPLIPLFLWLVGGAAEERTRRQWVTLSRLAARFLDALQALPTLRALGRAAAEAEALERASERHRAVTMGVLRVAFVSALVLEALATLGTAVVAVEVGLRLLYARIAFREALLVLVLAPEFYRPLRALGAAFHAGLPGREAARRIAVVLEADAPLAAPAVWTVAGEEASRSAGEGPDPPAPPAIAFEAVRLSYEWGRPAALDGFTLAIPAGATVALVGPTGAGKTTAAHLLLRFLEPDAGRIDVDGRPLAALAPEAWRRRVAFVPQRPRLFHGSLRANVLLARPGASPAELEEAARRAGLDAVLPELDRGWETPVGEKGERLSGGEAQRVALARAFLKDAPVLVLDEPTAQLDAATEARVVGAISDLSRGRTVLLVAHRLTTAMRADRVALVASGRVVEEGPPRALAKAGGAYARLLEAWEGA
ncbi:MAG TPA: thiol reductant ABC exporter subunit CydD [Vicinamibacteria bacterium]